jgi:hypothetical protein
MKMQKNLCLSWARNCLSVSLLRNVCLLCNCVDPKTFFISSKRTSFVKSYCGNIAKETGSFAFSFSKLDNYDGKPVNKQQTLEKATLECTVTLKDGKEIYTQEHIFKIHF